MKTWSVSCLALAGFIAATGPVFANDLADNAALSANIREMKIDSGLQAGNVVGGDVVVDHAAGTVTVTLYRKSTCPAGRLCLQVEMVPAPYRVSLPIVAENDANCGNKEILANQDLRPTDGDLEEIRVVDHSGERCEVARLHATEIYLDTTSARGLATHSVFGADSLRPFQAEQ